MSSSPECCLCLVYNMSYNHAHDVRSAELESSFRENKENFMSLRLYERAPGPASGAAVPVPPLRATPYTQRRQRPSQIASRARRPRTPCVRASTLE